MCGWTGTWDGCTTPGSRYSDTCTRSHTFHTHSLMFGCRSPLQAQLTPDQLVYDGRLLNYSSRLIPAVTSVLAEAGRAPGNLEHLLAGRNHPASLALA